MDFDDLSEEQMAKMVVASTPENMPCGKGKMIVMHYGLTCNKCGCIRY